MTRLDQFDCQSVKIFRNEGLLFPSRLHKGEEAFFASEGWVQPGSLECLVEVENRRNEPPEWRSIESRKIDRAPLGAAFLRNLAGFAAIARKDTQYA